MATATRPGAAGEAGAGMAPRRASLVLLALIVVAAVANLNLTVANVALPDIGRAFDAGQTALDLIALGYSLGLAGSVLYLGAVGDRYGRRMMLVLGVLLSVPACLLAAYAPDAGVLLAGRLLGGISAGMAYPTTLALITALWSGPARIRAIALWSGIGGAITALGPMLAGLVLQHFWWGSAFLLTLPLAVVALVLALACVPSHVNETTDTVDHLGGVLSMVFVAALVITINFAPVPGAGALALGTALAALAAGPSSSPPAPGPVSPLRPARGGTADLLGCGGGRDHRLRVADGGDLRGPAVPAGRARLLAAARRGRHPPRGRVHGGVRAAVGPAHPRPRVRLHPAQRVPVLPAQLRDHAGGLAAGQLLLGGRAGLRIPAPGWDWPACWPVRIP